MTQEHTYTSRFHRLKTIFSGGHKLAVPVSWVDGRTPKGHAWVGDGEGRYELQIAVGETVVEGGGEAMRKAISGRIADRLTAFGVGGQIGDSKIGLINDCMQIEVVADDPRIPTARTYSWIRLIPCGSTLLELGFHLIVLRELWERAATDDLIDLFGAQIRNVVVEQPQDLGFDRLRTINPFGFLSLQIPAHWIDEWDADAGMWYCGEAGDADTGSFWVDYRLNEFPVGADTIEQVLTTLRDDGGLATRQLSEHRGIGSAHSTETDDKDRLLHYFRWVVLHQASTTVVTAMFSLVLPPEEVTKPEYRMLVEVMARQAEELRLDESLIPQGSSPTTAGVNWAESVAPKADDRPPRKPAPSRFGFDRLRTITPFGFLTLQVPARWRDERDAESGDWFCGEDETDTGTLWIDYDSFAGSFGARGPERLFQKLGATVAWRPPGQGWRRIGYQSFTEDAAVKLRFHRWFVIDWTAERAVTVTLTLTLQAAWDGEPEFQRLLEILERQAAMLSIGALPG